MAVGRFEEMDSVDLLAPFERDTVLEVRTSRMKTMPGLTIQSGIDKELRSGKVAVSLLGLDADEHDPTFHGGIDKAIHGYCSSHYAQWAREYPEASARFVPGAFGENLVTARMNERNVCIGDIMSVGDDGVLLQVSLPRQPCFKLNHRFQLKNFAPNTYKKSRTGWYYRVLRTGTIQAGNEIRLVERRYPQWTIERVQEYLHRTLDNAQMNEELSQILEMGDESRKAFESRVARYKAKQKRLASSTGEKDEETKKEKWRKYKITEKKEQTSRVTSFVLEAVATPRSDSEDKDEEEEEGEKEEEIQHGSYARLRLPNGLVRSYSIISGEKARRFEIGVALEEPSRGGSAFLHKNASVGDVVEVGRITSDIKMKSASAASKHVFIVGGIGITAFLSLAEMYQSINYETVIHYSVRSGDHDVPFRERLEKLGLGTGTGTGTDSASGVILYDRSKGQRMDLGSILRNLGWNSYVYVCGPRRMLGEALREARACGLGEGEVHFEAFSADTTGDPFEAVVANRGGKVVQVPHEETLLEVLRQHFGSDDVPSSCEVGNCGTCRVALKDGRVEHRGTALLEEEKKEAMLSCVSRGLGRITIEI
ncbi:PK beta-barrel-protein domain-containing protein-like protein [Xylariaceae sp. FL0594]|nr:PK beta-barrel-protein domain-containing protein-like protein [Xylariaceae sp. FL0594]